MAGVACAGRLDAPDQTFSLCCHVSCPESRNCSTPYPYTRKVYHITSGCRFGFLDHAVIISQELLSRQRHPLRVLPKGTAAEC